MRAVRGIAGRNYPPAVIEAWAPLPITDRHVEAVLLNQIARVPRSCGYQRRCRRHGGTRKIRNYALATSHHLRAERVLTLPLRDRRGLMRVALLRHRILEVLTVLHINGWIQSQRPRWPIPNLGMVVLDQMNVAGQPLCNGPFHLLFLYLVTAVPDERRSL